MSIRKRTFVALLLAGCARGESTVRGDVHMYAVSLRHGLMADVLPGMDVGATAAWGTFAPSRETRAALVRDGAEYRGEFELLFSDSTLVPALGPEVVGSRRTVSHAVVTVSASDTVRTTERAIRFRRVPVALRVHAGDSISGTIGAGGAYGFVAVRGRVTADGTIFGRWTHAATPDGPSGTFEFEPVAGAPTRGVIVAQPRPR